MIIYSVEITVHEIISNEWVDWMNKTHIPDVMNTQLFVAFHFFKNINSENTYTIQYELDNFENFLKYEKKFAKKLQLEHSEKFKNKFKANRNIFIKKSLNS